MSKKRVGTGHPNEVAMARLNRQAKNAKRRKPPAMSDAGTKPSPCPRSIGPECLTPGLGQASGDPFATQGVDQLNY